MLRFLAPLALIAVGAGWPAPATAGPVAAVRVSSGATTVPGLPDGAAAAARMPEPTLPVPHGWLFPDSFSRTSGTGRLIAGSFEWTDWVYDAFGATGNGTSRSGTLGGLRGDYTYATAAAHQDGADIFRAAVGLTATTSLWRVDWNTLADPSVPIAEWTFDTDDDDTTGGTVWPGSANVSSKGIDRALIVSAKGARLLDAVSGSTIATFPTAVDTAARSFVVAIPRAVMPVGGQWRIRLAAGVADAAGVGFAVPVDSSGKAVSDTAPRVYNITFRTAQQEPGIYDGATVNSATGQVHTTITGAPIIGGYQPTNVIDEAASLTSTEVAERANPWAEANQAETLAAGGDVSRFSRVLTWADLATKTNVAPPQLTGWSDRWYVTDLKLGDGTEGEVLKGRIQPYAVFVPTTYSAQKPAPLSWFLHGSGPNYRERSATNPRMSKQLCQDRGSICVTSEGFEPTSYYAGIGEHDFWQVWRQVALAFNVAPDRTIVTGYSMGGQGSFNLATSYPSVFSEALPLDGSFENACTTLPAGAEASFLISGSPDRSGNVRWVPMLVSSAYADELSHYSNIVAQIQRYQAAGNRFILWSTTGGEHIVTVAEDGFSTQVKALKGAPQATTRPGSIDYSWCRQVVDAQLGLGPSSVYWLSGLAQRATGATAISHITADDGALPGPSRTLQLSTSAEAPADAPPMHVLTGSWKLGPTPAPTSKLSLGLTNVATASVDTARANLPTGVATVTSDGPSTITLAHLARGTVVSGPHRRVVAGADETVAMTVGQGVTTISWTAAANTGRAQTAASGSGAVAAPTGSLAATGLPATLPALAAIALLAAVALRRTRRTRASPDARELESL